MASAHGTPSIPQDWTDVDPNWMANALALRFPNARIEDVSLSWHSDGSNRRARFAVSDAAGLVPSEVFVKSEGAHRDTHARNGNLFNESKLLASGLPLPVDHPEPFAVLIDEERLDWLVIMEDVTHRGADPRDATRPMTPRQVENGARGLGRLHRQFWGCEPTGELSWLQTWAPTEGFQSGLRRRAPHGLARSADQLPDQIRDLSGDDVVDLWARYVALLDREPVTLLHADAHIGNTYVLPDDEVGFLDWQVARRGNWSQDVGHFVQGSLVEDDRRRAERDILTAYLDELDTGPGFDEAWCWYRASAFYGLAIWLSTLGTDGYQPHEVSASLAARFAAAVVDLDAFDALHQLESEG